MLLMAKGTFRDMGSEQHREVYDHSDPGRPLLLQTRDVLDDGTKTPWRTIRVEGVNWKFLGPRETEDGRPLPSFTVKFEACSANKADFYVDLVKVPEEAR